MNTNYLKLAIQKDGRLTEETLMLLRASGLSFESYKRKLFSTCRNFPLEILYVRDDDIAGYVSAGTVDLGIVGQNILNEERPNVKKLLNLRYGFCTLTLSVPKESTITSLSDLEGKTIATSYPRSAKLFFEKNGVTIKTVTIRGSVEITPALGIAAAIVDLTSTGSTIAMNDLRALASIYPSEAVLISSPTSRSTQKQQIATQLITRFKSVLSAKAYKFVVMNAPQTALPKLKKILPGFIGNQTGAQGVLKEDVFWANLKRLQQLGATNFYMMPVEKII